MNIRFLTFSIFILLSSYSFSQFNTLTPIVIKEENNDSLQRSKEVLPKKKEKKIKIKRTTKRDLKNEIDSLKIMIKDLNNNKSKIKDSLLLSSQLKKLNESLFAIYKPKIKEVPKIIMPLDKKLIITSNYGTRIHPINKNIKLHNGVDFRANYENVYTVLDGTISDLGWDKNGGGNYIKVKHYNGFETAYLHLSEMYYKIGDKVKAGFIIAKSGNTGNTTGPHLHFSVRHQGKILDPIIFLNDLVNINNLINK